VSRRLTQKGTDPEECALKFELCALNFAAFYVEYKQAIQRTYKHKVQSTKHKVQSTKHKVQSMSLIRVYLCSSAAQFDLNFSHTEQETFEES
jgi:phage-related protein